MAKRKKKPQDIPADFGALAGDGTGLINLDEQRRAIPGLAPDPPTPDPYPWIAPDLRHLAVEIDLLIPDPKNARKHNDANLEAIKTSLKSFGQVKPVVVREQTGIIACGNGTLQAAKLLGWTHLARVRKSLTDDETKALAIIDNRASDLAEWDHDILGELLKETKIDDDDLNKLLKDLEQENAPDPIDPKLKTDESGELFKREFSVLVRCEDEPTQKSILEELHRHQLDASALIVDFPHLETRRVSEGSEPITPAPGAITITRQIAIQRSPRVLQLEGLFDVPPADKAAQSWTVNLELDKPWNIGLIVGPSGSGKSTVAQELLGAHLVDAWPWSQNKALIDDFPDLPIAHITAILSSVGFSSPPGWLKPYHVLSNGEKFRVHLARTLAENPELAVIDEYSSVVDRTVAQIGSAALAKAVRTAGGKLVAVTCHYDVEDWLQPDWKLEMPACALAWRSLRRRPEIRLHVSRTGHDNWSLFARHHYLNGDLSRAAQCFLGSVETRRVSEGDTEGATDHLTPAAFVAVLHTPNAFGGFWRESRCVCLPDFQGVGIGNAISEHVAALFAGDKPYRSTTSHPAMIRHRLRSPLWRCVRKPGLVKPGRGIDSKTCAAYRYTAGFEYIGPIAS